MIRYALACEAGHVFESWFPSSGSYEEQAARGLVACPLCGSVRVGKTIMAPALGRGTPEVAVAVPAEPGPAHPSPSPPVPAGSPLDGEPARRLRAMLRAMHAHVRATAEDVGTNFAREVRAMQDGRVPERAVYGEATLGEARDLIEEGIAVQPLPPLPDERN